MIDTSDLPSGFPSITIHHCETNRREPGYIILSIGKGVRAISSQTDYEVLVALDQRGNVAWYWESRESLMDVKLTQNNSLLVLTTDGCIQEIDFRGKILKKWSTPGRNPRKDEQAIEVDTLYFHHALQELPNGNISTLSVSKRSFPDYPLNQDDLNGVRGSRLLVGDTLVEFQRDGTIVNEFEFFDILDPYRFGYGIDGPFWARVGVVPNGADWSHANGICYDCSDDSWIITVRHQDCVIKVDRRSGHLRWILGCPDGWNVPWNDKLLKPLGKVDWHWHSHDPSITSDGSILLFDNGHSAAFPPSPRPDIKNCNSRAVLYHVDEASMTVKQAWSYGGEDGKLPYSMYVSGAHELPASGNIFITCGGITLTKDTKSRTNLPPLGHGSIELFEVTRDKDSEILFHAEINNRDTDELEGWAAFRAEWVPSDFLSM